MDALLFHNLHLPAEVRVFTVPHADIRRNDHEALVYDVCVGPGAVLRHYSWAHRWFEVNCTFSCGGDLVEADGPVRWAFNCDISTPHLIVGGAAYNVDLELDVLVSADAAQYAVTDRADFIDAVDRGWMDAEEARRAEQGLDELLAMIRNGSFRPFLESVCPFSTLQASATQPPAQRRPLDEVPLLQSAGRRAWLL